RVDTDASWEFPTAEGGCAPMPFESVIESSRELLCIVFKKHWTFWRRGSTILSKRLVFQLGISAVRSASKQFHLSPLFVSVTQRPATPQEGYRYGLDQT